MGKMDGVLDKMLNNVDMFCGNVVRLENRYFNPTVLGWRDVQLLVRVPLSRKDGNGGAVQSNARTGEQRAANSRARRASAAHPGTSGSPRGAAVAATVHCREGCRHVSNETFRVAATRWRSWGGGATRRGC